MKNFLFDSLAQKIRSVDLDRRRHWHVFRAFNVYRLVLVSILLGTFWANGSHYLGGRYPTLFLYTSGVYLVFIALALIGSWRRRPSFSIQTLVQGLVDIVALSLIGIASGGNDAVMVALLLVAVASNSIMLSLTAGLSLALLTWLLMLGYKLLLNWHGFVIEVAPERLSPAVLGLFAQFSFERINPPALLFVALLLATVVLLTFFLAERIRRHEVATGQEISDMLRLAQLSQLIVQQLPSGILVVDRFARIRLMNATAAELLDQLEPLDDDTPLSDVSPQLSQRLATWLSIAQNNPRPFRHAEHLPDVTPTFTTLNDGKRTGDTLIFLEDSAQSAQRLQQIKMVSLGRLTSSIAHEVRNPLASISHASQLLQESPTASNGDKRLGQIIHDNAKRANVIIANVLDLSRRDKVKPEEFMLKPWLREFCQEFVRGRSEPLPVIEQLVEPDDLVVRFDANHLRQVLWNLLTNACSHGTPAGEPPRLRIRARLDQTTGYARPMLDVIDGGPGIPEAEVQRIFEPFFTTKAQGSGLGLYISREVCEANRGQLQYLRDGDKGRFRIVFPVISKHEKQALRTLRKVALH